LSSNAGCHDLTFFPNLTIPVAGYTGATLHSAFAGAGTAVNGSVTFAGLSRADSQSKLSVTPGNAGGRSYLSLHYNG